jgi:hypothetical protein
METPFRDEPSLEGRFNAYGAVVNSSIFIGYQRQDGQDGEAQTSVTATNEECFNVIVITLQASASRNASY